MYGKVSMPLQLLWPLVQDTKEEQCGLLIGRHRGLRTYVRRIVFLTNNHPDPEHYFSMRVPKSLLSASVGVIHTHTGDITVDPSEEDLASLRGRDIGVVVHTTTWEVSFFRKHSGEFHRTVWK